MGKWIKKVRRNYDKQNDKISEENRLKWSETVKFYPLLTDRKSKNKQNLQNLVIFLQEKKMKPKTSSENQYESKLAIWMENYVRRMKNNTKARKIWKEAMKPFPMMSESKTEKFKRETDYDIDFIEKNQRNVVSKMNKEETNVINRIRKRNYTYERKIGDMKNKEIHEIWKNALESHPVLRVLRPVDYLTTWKQNFYSLVYFVEKTGRLPRETMKNITERDLRRWMRNQNTLYENKRGTIFETKECKELWED